MDTLRDEISILRLSERSSSGRNFVPEGRLFTIVTKGKIRACLEEMRVADHEREELVEAIFRGARRCFSILLLLKCGDKIPLFFKHDLMQKSSPDDRFPYTIEPLQRVLGNHTSRAFFQEFMEMQWCFMAPVFRSQSIVRELDKCTILPFVKESLLGSGAMGDAYLVTLHPECHDLPIAKHQVVRKELKQSAEETMESFMREVKHLALLAHLKHPNIIKLHCSYVYEFPSRRCNFIFDFAEGGSLARLLEGGYDGPKLDACQLLWGMADLASAIDAVHNFVCDTLDLQRTGCHHDLKPQNILIQADTLVLIDFGLSTFRNPDEDSLTLFKETRGSYVAPECQSFIDGRIKTNEVGRSSDIWSFGCILSEVFTFLVLGPSGVRLFRDKRFVPFAGGISWPRFHIGPEKPNPAVEEWLGYIDHIGKDEAWALHLTKLIRWTLTLDPKQRPTSSEVLQTISWIAAIALSESISRIWDEACGRMHSSKLCALESYRFKSWSSTLQQLQIPPDDGEDSSSIMDYSRVKMLLKAEQDILNSLQGPEDTASVPLLRKISKVTTSLVQALPLPFKDRFNRRLMDMALQVSDMDELGNISHALKEGPGREMGTLLAMRRLMILADRGNLTERKDLILDAATLEIEEVLGIHSLAKLGGQSVIVEWLRYDGSWADGSVSSRILQRLSTMASLLNDQNTETLTGTLHCQGFFHEPAQNSFGLVYRMPQVGHTPWTLHQLLQETIPGKKRSRFRPPLEYRFRLALDLCQSVQALHEIKWLHRNINSMNILCFSPPGARDADAAQNMRLIGLGASREDAHDSFTQGHDEGAQLRNYQHPSYLYGARYRAEFDYYSTLSWLSKGFRGMDDETFRRSVIQKHVSQLEMTMGSQYMEAVRWCIEGDSLLLPNEAARSRDLKEMVIGQLHEFGNSLVAA
ncbi:kinase domain-containing protein [Fusarium flagelliforme]|uniref:kinase domain-containing protein n=1 Tax=Fusarium flagelliforme TaxID=2675880 RepID=UPI001E8E39EA|nr:kinase domain-containing protein [Fusarium flagelliforme]KAH7174757.1 kinase domain-containing protein [Fusarium flagelliforme]